VLRHFGRFLDVIMADKLKVEGKPMKRTDSASSIDSGEARDNIFVVGPNSIRLKVRNRRMHL